MSGRTRMFAALLAVVLMVGVAIVEAVRTGEAGILGLLIVIQVLVVGVLVTLRFTGPVTVRGDLMRWLESTSAITGETTSALADRALSAYRASMNDDEQR